MASGSFANKNQYSDRIRRAEQCWLIANAQKLIDANAQEEKNYKIFKHASNTHHISLGPDSRIEDSIGRYFVGTDNEVLFDIETEELSSLIPKIDLYRIDLDENGVLIPGTTRGFFFPTHTNKKSVQRMITGDDDRFGEAGIQSVSWDLLGGDPVRAKRYVQVKIDFFFSSMSAMAGGGAAGAPSYLDLIRRVRGVGTSYKLRLDVGYAEPDKDLVSFKNRNRATKIKDAIRNMNKSLWLQLKNHEFSFDQDGTIKLSTEYIASLEYELTQINVIKDVRTVEQRKEQQQKLVEANRIYERFKSSKCTPKAIKTYVQTPYFSLPFDFSAEGPVSRTRRENHAKTLRQMKARLNFLNGRKQRIGLQVLGVINKHLHKEMKIVKQGANQNDKLTRSRVFCIDVLPIELGFTDSVLTKDTGLFVKASSDKNILLSQNYRQYRSKNPRKYIPFPVFDYYKFKTISSPNQISNSAPAATVKKQIKSLYRRFKTTTTSKNKKSLIKYCFLGDIVDAVIDACKELYGNEKKKSSYDSNLNSILRNMKIVFGHINIPVYGDDNKATTMRINLNDLPISYNLFNAWFIRTIIDGGKGTLNLKDFLRNLMLDLAITAASGRGCFAKEDPFFKNYPRNRLELTFNTVRVSKKGLEVMTREAPDKPLSEVSMFKKRLSSSDLIDNYKQASGQDVKLVNYLLINTVSTRLSNRIKNRARDVRNGVFHFNIGQDNGMIKNIQFKREDAKALEAALLTTSYGRSDLDLFRRVYSVSIDMYGNSSFIPGQMIYVDPITAGLGDVSKNGSFARQMGLGGYYLITGVRNSIKRGEYTTSLDARWVGFGDYFDIGKGPKPDEVLTPIKFGATCNEAERARLITAFENLGENFKLEN